MRRSASALVSGPFLAAFIGGCTAAAPGASIGDNVDDLDTARTARASVYDREQSAPPHVFDLGDVSRRQIDDIRKIPGIVDAWRMRTGRVRVVWQPFRDEARWHTPEKRLEGSDRIYDYLVIKGRLGGTRWTHGGRSSGRIGTILGTTRSASTFRFNFNDASTRSNETMGLHCFPEATPEQVEHEMLGDVPGTDVSIDKCGDGYVIVSHAGRGTFVVWQVSPQMFVRIDNSYDRAMVAAYVDRLGSIIPKDYKVDVDEWTNKEIYWRLRRVWNSYLFDAEQVKASKRTEDVHFEALHVVTTFPDVFQRFGRPRQGEPLEAVWNWVTSVRDFLWANRGNFRYDDRARGYVLKGPDRYDPGTPPSLPEELGWNKDRPVQKPSAEPNPPGDGGNVKPEGEKR